MHTYPCRRTCARLAVPSPCCSRSGATSRPSERRSSHDERPPGSTTMCGARRSGCGQSGRGPSRRQRRRRRPSGARDGTLRSTLENTSSIDLDVEVESAPAWLRVSPVTLPRSATALLRGRVLEGAPAGPQQIALGVRVRNLHVRPDAQLRATLTLRAVIESMTCGAGRRRCALTANGPLERFLGRPEGASAWAPAGPWARTAAPVWTRRASRPLDVRRGRRDIHLAVAAFARDRGVGDLHRRGRDVQHVELLGERFTTTRASSRSPASNRSRSEPRVSSIRLARGRRPSARRALRSSAS